MSTAHLHHDFDFMDWAWAAATSTSPRPLSRGVWLALGVVAADAPSLRLNDGRLERPLRGVIPAGVDSFHARQMSGQVSAL